MKCPDASPFDSKARLTVLARAALTAVLLVVAGCRQLNLKDGFPCSKNKECPSPYRCAADQKCYRNLPPGDGGPADATDARDATSQDGSGGRDGSAADGPASDSPTADTGSDNDDAGNNGDTVSLGDAAAGSVETGQPCDSPSSCKSGFCVDGVCCGAKCDGTCAACAASLTGKDNGTCAPVNSGLDPHNSCTAGAPETCGNDGWCDGAGACRKYGANQVCAAASCAASTFTAARTCDGKGACGAGTMTPCGTAPCTLTGCAAPCTKDTECTAIMASSFCEAGTCKAKKANGETCAGTSQCVSGFCVDGVCCDTGCTGACQSCVELNTGQKSGSCQSVQAGKDPDDDCPTDAPSTCGRDGTCDGKGACAKYGASTKCADPTCVGATFTPARSCAAGVCAAAAPIDCGQNQCALEGCRTGCTTDQNCGTSAYCASMTCVAKKANGADCTAGNQCVSNACVDGKCCETACTGKCYACASTKTNQADGKCAPIATGTDPDSECPDTDASTCGTEGKCDGAGACRLWSKGTTCAAGMCNTAGNYLSARTCDGVGTCAAATTDVCGANVCTATGCSRTCTTDAQCTGNSYCAGTMCAAKKNTGDACTQANQCTSGFCSPDGFCCDSKCDGKCVACSKAKTGQADGKCAAIPSGMDPDKECPADATKPCGFVGCNGQGACLYKAAGQSCGNPTCMSSNSYSSGGMCDGAGNCDIPTAQPCPNGLTCQSTTACKTTCSVDGDCANSASNYCSGGKCMAKKGAGVGCSSGGECTSGTCSGDKHCCNSACNASGGCQSCTTGTCSTSGNVCNNQCVNTSSDPNNCGTCGKICNAAAGGSYCIGSACHQCRTFADCPTTTFDCVNNTCVCRRPVSTTVVDLSEGFDTAASKNGWVSDSGGAITWNANDDADGCPNSGSLSFTDTVHKCFGMGAAGNANYTFGLRYKQAGTNGCIGQFFEDRGCTRALGSAFLNLSLPDASPSDWAPFGQWAYTPDFGTSVKSPDGTLGIQVTCFGPMAIDQIFFSTSGGTRF